MHNRTAFLFDYPPHPCYNYSNKKNHGGKCMHYYEYGKENDKTIVFLHGANFVHSFVLSATQNAKSGKPRDKPKLSGINQYKADCYAVCCVSQVVYPARCSKVSCQKNRCVFAPIFLYLLKRRSVLNNRFKLF